MKRRSFFSMSVGLFAWAVGFKRADATDGTPTISGIGAIHREGHPPCDSVFVQVKNSAAIPLKFGRLLKWKNGKQGQEVDGYYEDTNQPPAGVVDDQLPAAGVKPGNMFWMQIKGQVTVAVVPRQHMAGSRNR